MTSLSKTKPNRLPDVLASLHHLRARAHTRLHGFGHRCREMGPWSCHRSGHCAPALPGTGVTLPGQRDLRAGVGSLGLSPGCSMPLIGTQKWKMGSQWVGLRERD